MRNEEPADLDPIERAMALRRTTKSGYGQVKARLSSKAGAESLVYNLRRTNPIAMKNSEAVKVDGLKSPAEANMKLEHDLEEQKKLFATSDYRQFNESLK